MKTVNDLGHVQYPHIEGLRGDEGENSATLAVAAVLDSSPHYPDVARIIVGSPRSSDAEIGGFSCSPDVARQIAATLVQAADDVDAARGATKRPPDEMADALDRARSLSEVTHPYAWSSNYMSEEHYDAASEAMLLVPRLLAILAPREAVVTEHIETLRGMLADAVAENRRSSARSGDPEFPALDERLEARIAALRSLLAVTTGASS